MKGDVIPQRNYRDNVQLSIIGFGGILVVGMRQGRVDRIVSEAIDLGVNYFDVAPLYGDGEAEEKLGIALRPYRERVFLACKTMQRDSVNAQKELDRSLKRLRTDHFDLYQFHRVCTSDDVERIFARGGAVETFERAREQGKVRFLGFSAHTVEAALAMMDRFHFDSVMFPINFVCYASKRFGPQVLKRAREEGLARLALKALAHGPLSEGEKAKYPNLWYRPIDDQELAREALRFTLTEDITALIPPGDEQHFRLALNLAASFEPLSQKERSELLASAQGLQSLVAGLASPLRP